MKATLAEDGSIVFEEHRRLLIGGLAAGNISLFDCLYLIKRVQSKSLIPLVSICFVVCLLSFVYALHKWTISDRRHQIRRL